MELGPVEIVETLKYISWLLPNPGAQGGKVAVEIEQTTSPAAPLTAVAAALLTKPKACADFHY